LLVIATFIGERFKVKKLPFVASLMSLALFVSIKTEAMPTIDVVRYVDSQKHPDSKKTYFIDLLNLILEASKPEYGDYKLQPVAIEMAQARTSLMLERNQYIDITWRMTSQQLESQLQAIYFPILKGLMGYRIFVINKNEQNNFTLSTSLHDLQNLHLGQGYNWPDTKILLANGFSVIQGHENFLLGMLKKGRFSYFPRALHEPWPEIANDNSLSVEQHIMLQYPAPVFFFVNKNNKKLQQRLNLGVNKLIESGQFDQFFLNHPITASVLQRAKVKQRHIFTLQNPFLSMQTKTLLANDKLWINLPKKNDVKNVDF
jgi:hypothetical protein